MNTITMRPRNAAETARACTTAYSAGVGRAMVKTRLGLVLRGWRLAWKRHHLAQATIREMNALSDEMLADIGVSRADIPALARKLANSSW